MVDLTCVQIFRGSLMVVGVVLLVGIIAMIARQAVGFFGCG